MAKKKSAKLPLIPEDRLEPLRAEVERLADQTGMGICQCRRLPYYHAIVYYVMFSHLLEEMREKLGGIDDAAALANAYFWYSVVSEFARRIEPGSNPLEGEMDHVEGAPTLHFDEQEDIAIWNAAAQYVTCLRRRRRKDPPPAGRHAAGRAQPWVSGLPRPAVSRKDRLFACGCVRQVWDLLAHPASRAAVEVAERAADGEATAHELGAAGRAARAVVRAGRRANPTPTHWAAEAAAWATARRPADAAREAGWFAYRAVVGSRRLRRSLDRHAVARAIRPWREEIFPFPDPPALPAVAADWLGWGSGTVRLLACGIYDSGAFDRLPILADALEDAGCADPDILAHCRSPGPHVRGCWVVDLLLGKG
jgi:hypothetical protein